MLIKELSVIPGVSGDETRVRNYIREKVTALGLPSHTDSLGNLYVSKEGRRRGAPPELMLTAHMDEVGLMVSSIEKSGHLRFYKVGGVYEEALISKPVKIGTADILGVIGAKAIHLQKKEERKKALTIENLYIDIGAKDKEDAEKVVKVGDYVSFYSEASRYEDIIRGKAFDNRAGCAALLEILKRDYPCSFTVVFTVQEEVGIRGARVAAYRVNPRLALVIETTIAADTPEIKEHELSTSLGGGPAFTVKDDSVIVHPHLLDRLVQVAGEQKRPYQFRRFGGSFTDAGAIATAGGGVAAAVISTPCRYIHSPFSMLNLKDWHHLVEIVDGFIRSIDEKGLEI